MKKLIEWFRNKYVASTVRGLLRALGGALVMYGIPQNMVDPFLASAEPVAVGAAILVLGQVMSFMDKKKQD